MAALLEVENLNTRFDTPDGEVKAVNAVSFAIAEGETVGVVGESGSGKSQAFLSVMGLLAANGHATGSARFRGAELIGMTPHELNRIRGSRVAMIFQDAMTSLNPYLRISRQMTEVLVTHRGMGESEARKAAVAMLDRVRIPEAKRRLDMYPHEFSGGMRQRVMIAMALLCEPELLIADEPTTALDVTIQAQILDLLRDLKRGGRTAIVMITHAIGVVVASGEQARAGGGAQRGRMEVAEPQAARGQPVERRRPDVGAEAAQLREADVIENDVDDVRRPGRGLLPRPDPPLPAHGRAAR